MGTYHNKVQDGINTAFAIGSPKNNRKRKSGARVFTEAGAKIISEITGVPGIIRKIKTGSSLEKGRTGFSGLKPISPYKKRKKVVKKKRSGGHGL